MKPRSQLLAVFVLALAVFLASPVSQMTDSAFTLLVTQSLLENRSFDLGGYTYAPAGERPVPIRSIRRLPSQLFRRGGHVHHRYPPGTSLLALPAVALTRPLGLAPASPGGEYVARRERTLQKFLAGGLMALFAVVTYAAAREMLPAGYALLLTAGAAFGTQAWSTASRGLWSHTCAIVLLAFIVRAVLRHEVRGAPLRPVLLGTLAAWGFFVRPTFAVTALALGVYLLARRRGAVLYALASGAWCSLFVLYARRTSGGAVPDYYAGRFMTFETYGASLVAHLVSPSRGLLVFVPTVAWIAVLLAVQWKEARHRALAGLAAGAIVLHLLVISGSPNWWAGHCYGPRLTTDLVPWFALAGMIGLDALRRGGVGTWSGAALRWSGLLLLATSFALNGAGAIYEETKEWNRVPRNIAADPARAWSWSEPQFLARWNPALRGPAPDAIQDGGETGEPGPNRGKSPSP